MGTPRGRVMTRASGSFDIRTTKNELITSSYKFLKKAQNADGYQYVQRRTTDKDNQISRNDAFLSAIE